MGLANDLIERAKRIKMVILDVDGVMTDGRFSLTSDGGEIKTFHVRDGLGVKLLQKAGIECSIISAMASQVVERRASQLGIRNVFVGEEDKGAAFERILASKSFRTEEICAMGDDLLDLAILMRVGLAACPGDAVQEVRDKAHFVTERKGGYGAVRELAEMILKAQGAWNWSRP